MPSISLSSRKRDQGPTRAVPLSRRRSTDPAPSRLSRPLPSPFSGLNSFICLKLPARPMSVAPYPSGEGRSTLLRRLQSVENTRPERQASILRLQPRKQQGSRRPGPWLLHNYRKKKSHGRAHRDRFAAIWLASLPIPSRLPPSRSPVLYSSMIARQAEARDRRSDVRHSRYPPSAATAAHLAPLHWSLAPLAATLADIPASVKSPREEECSPQLRFKFLHLKYQWSHGRFTVHHSPQLLPTNPFPLTPAVRRSGLRPSLVPGRLPPQRPPDTTPPARFGF